MTRTTVTPVPTMLKEIAHRHLGLETLATRNNDSLDFHDMAVWSMRAALEAAYEAGRAQGGLKAAKIFT